MNSENKIEVASAISKKTFDHKSVTVTSEVHARVRDYCKAHDLRTSKWASSVLLKAIENPTTITLQPTV